jgi:ribosome recycling factor
MSVSKKLTQSGNELTADQAAELEKEMQKIDTKYSHKISKAQMDYDKALIEFERAQDSVHEAKVEYERTGGH